MNTRQTVLQTSTFFLFAKYHGPLHNTRRILMNQAPPFSAAQGVKRRPAATYPGSPREPTARAALPTAPRRASLRGSAARTSRPSPGTRTADTAASRCLRQLLSLQESLLENQTEALAGSASINNEQT